MKGGKTTTELHELNLHLWIPTCIGNFQDHLLQMLGSVSASACSFSLN